MQQYPLQFPVVTRYREDDFLPGACNEAALLAVQEWAAQTRGAYLLRGPKASGKTHLASIWAQHCSAKLIEATELVEATAPEGYFDGQSALVVENIEQLGEESALFHLLNMVAREPFHLLLTVDEAACWGAFKLADLRSRLQALPQAGIQEPDESLLTALLVKQFHDRQLHISADLPDYLIRRIERSFAAVQEAVEALDKLASSRKRPITQALARDWLDL